MKIHKKTNSLPIVLFIGVSLAWTLTSGGAPQTDPIEVRENRPEERRPDFTGVWVNEGELCALIVLADGTCLLEYDDSESGIRGVEIPGRWMRRGRVLTVVLRDKWQGKKVHTYHFFRETEGEGQDLLMVKRDGEEWFQFYRD